MPEIHGLHIPAAQHQPIKLIGLEQGDIRAYQRIVDGLFDVVDLEEPAASLFFNDEGKLMGLPINPRATMLMWLGNTRFMGADLVVGDCLLLGAPDSQGVTTGVPEHYKTLLLTGSVFEVQVRPDKGGDWQQEGHRFNTWDMSYGYAIALYMESERPLDARVVPIQ